MNNYRDIYAKAQNMVERRNLGMQIGSFLVTENGLLYIQFDNFNGKSFEDVTGWKAHISVAPESLAEALRIIAGIAEQENISTFKVIRPDPEIITRFSNSTYEQAGKMFTIYHFGEENFERIIGKIERAFQKYDIRRGVRINGENQIEGSTYGITFRNDGNKGGTGKNYRIAGKAPPVNPANDPTNPFRGVNFSPPEKTIIRLQKQM
jgi:hypothetical protein